MRSKDLHQARTFTRIDERHLAFWRSYERCVTLADVEEDNFYCRGRACLRKRAKRNGEEPNPYQKKVACKAPHNITDQDTSPTSLLPAPSKHPLAGVDGVTGHQLSVAPVFTGPVGVHQILQSLE